MKISELPHIDPLWGYLELKDGSLVALPKQAIKELQAENERLKYALKQRTAQSDTNANLWMKELKTGAKQEKEIERLNGENAKLKCLALHAMSELFYYKREYLEALPFNNDHEIEKYFNLWAKFSDAYRKAKKALREGK